MRMSISNVWAQPQEDACPAAPVRPFYLPARRLRLQDDLQALAHQGVIVHHRHAHHAHPLLSGSRKSASCSLARRELSAQVRTFGHVLQAHSPARPRLRQLCGRLS